MKRIFILLSIVTMGISAKAQLDYDNYEEGDAEYLFTSRSTIVKLGVGQAPQANQIPYYSSYNLKSALPFFSINLERGAFNLGKGFVLGYIGGIHYTQAIYTLNPDSFWVGDAEDIKTNYIGGSAGISLHKSFGEKFEVYGNAVLYVDFPLSGEIPESIPEKINDLIRPSLGIRYNIFKNVGIFAEGSTGREQFRAGISFFR